MRRPLVAVAATAALAVPALTPMAAQARPHADAPANACDIKGISPGTVVLGNSPLVKRFSVLTAGACDMEGWELTAPKLGWRAPSDEEQEFSDVTRPNGPGSTRDESWTFYGDDLIGGDFIQPGKYSVAVHVLDGDFVDHNATVSFYLKKNTSWAGSFNAGPEPVKKNANLTVSATLVRADWIDPHYSGYGNRIVSVQFKADGAGSYGTVKHAQLSSTGHLSTTVKATEAGNWRVIYYGNDGAGAATSNADHVAVK